MIRPPIPPIDIFKIITIGKKIIRVIKDLFAGDDETKKQDPLTKDSDLSEVATLNGVLLEYRNQVKHVADELEKDIIAECMEVFNKIIDIFQSANDSYEIYRVERLKRKFDRMINNIPGVFERHVAKRISLDDIECSEILKMLPGETKGERMKSLKKKVFIEAIEDITHKLNEAVEELLEDIDDAIQMRLDTMKNQLEEKALAYDSIICSAKEKGNESQVVKLNATYLLAMTELVDDLVSE